MDYTRPEGLLGACPTFKNLTADQKQQILDSIPTLAVDAVGGVGTASDELMEWKFGHFLGTAQRPEEDEDDEDSPQSSSSSSTVPTQTRSAFGVANKKKKRPLTDYVLNRWRTTLLTSPAA